jgi:hypothetical protein
MKARSGKQVNRTVKRREALRQQRSDFVRAHGYESARRDRIVTSDRTAGQDREDGQKAAKRQAAVAAVGDGAFRTKTRLHSTSDVESIERLVQETHRAFKET